MDIDWKKCEMNAHDVSKDPIDCTVCEWKGVAGDLIDASYNDDGGEIAYQFLCPECNECLM